MLKKVTECLWASRISLQPCLSCLKPLEAMAIYRRCFVTVFIVLAHFFILFIYNVF